MREEFDNNSGKKWIHLSIDELKLGFLAQCVEAVAEAEQTDYMNMLDRMENVGLTQDYILKHYDVLHTESIENIIIELQNILHERESNLLVKPRTD